MLDTLPFFMFCHRQDAWRLSSLSCDQSCIKSRADQGHFTEKRCMHRYYKDRYPTWSHLCSQVLDQCCPVNFRKKMFSLSSVLIFFSLSNSPLFVKDGLYYSSVILVVELLGEERCYK